MSPNKTSSLKKRSSLPGPYPLMWLTDEYCPYFEDIGIGIGCLKVYGNRQTARSLCPGAIVLDKKHDPIRKHWLPHGYSLVEPPIPADARLRLRERRWQPHVLESSYELNGRRFQQQAVVFDHGAQVCIASAGGGKLSLRGSSADACKLWYDDNGLHVIETSVELRPMTYRITFDPPPDRVTVTPTPSDGQIRTLVYFDRRAQWTFDWKRLPRRLVMEVSIEDRVQNPGMSTPQPFARRLSQQADRWRKLYRHDAPRLITPDERLNVIFD